MTRDLHSLRVRSAAVWLVVLFAVTACHTKGGGFGGPAPPGTEPEAALTAFLSQSTSIGAPLRFFVLVREHDEYCAVRFLRQWQVSGQSGQGNGYADYETYSARAPFTLQSAGAERIQDRASRLRGIGVAHNLMWQPGNMKIQCGRIILPYLHPVLGTEPYGDDARSRRLLFALTPWESINEVDAGDPRLRWFSPDPNMRRVDVAVGEVLSGAF